MPAVAHMEGHLCQKGTATTATAAPALVEVIKCVLCACELFSFYKASAL